VAKWDFSKIIDWCGQNKTEWIVVPTGGQHFNGQAERLIGLAKNCLQQVLEGKTATFGEMQTALKQVQYMLNLRSLAVKPGSDPESMGPITPLHLMGVRASIYLPEINLEAKPAKLVER
jgi:hypothetical protein